MDPDAIKARNYFERRLRQIDSERADILIGLRALPKAPIAQMARLVPELASISERRAKPGPAPKESSTPKAKPLPRRVAKVAPKTPAAMVLEAMQHQAGNFTSTDIIAYLETRYPEIPIPRQRVYQEVYVCRQRGQVTIVKMGTKGVKGDANILKYNPPS
jgi:hypothetical protein